jgi:hypothetical protein
MALNRLRVPSPYFTCPQFSVAYTRRARSSVDLRILHRGPVLLGFCNSSAVFGLDFKVNLVVFGAGFLEKVLVEVLARGPS